jgi:hypothetical protein
MELLKLHGRSTFSASWTAHGGFGVGGDSGAWVVSSDGKVCGHVLAERTGRTYICPMDLLFADIRETLGAVDVALPKLCEASMGAKGAADESMEAAVARLNLGDYGGGVPVSRALSSGGVRYTGQKQEFARSVEPLRSAG